MRFLASFLAQIRMETGWLKLLSASLFLGNENEPLLAAALNDIAGGSRFNIKQVQPVKLFGDSNDLIPFGKEMYIDKDIPEDVISNFQYK